MENGKNKIMWIDWSRYTVNSYGYLVDRETGEEIMLYEYDYGATPTSLVEVIKITLSVV